MRTHRVACARSQASELRRQYYDCALAPNPRRHKLCLNEIGLAVDTLQINLRAGEKFSASFLKLKPQAGVPCLQFDDRTLLTETMAIGRYLEAPRPSP